MVFIFGNLLISSRNLLVNERKHMKREILKEETLESKAKKRVIEMVSRN